MPTAVMSAMCHVLVTSAHFKLNYFGRMSRVAFPLVYAIGGEFISSRDQTEKKSDTFELMNI